MIISALVAMLAVVAKGRFGIGRAVHVERGRSLSVHADARNVVVPTSRSVSFLFLSCLAGGDVRMRRSAGREKVLGRRSIALCDALLYRALFFATRHANCLI